MGDLGGWVMIVAVVGAVLVGIFMRICAKFAYRQGYAEGMENARQIITEEGNRAPLLYNGEEKPLPEDGPVDLSGGGRFA